MNKPAVRLERLTGWLPLALIALAAGVLPLSLMAEQPGASSASSRSESPLPRLKPLKAVAAATRIPAAPQGEQRLARNPATDPPPAVEPIPATQLPAMQPPVAEFGELQPDDDGGPACCPTSLGDCGGACPRTWYFQASALCLQRASDDGRTLTVQDTAGLDGFGYEPGARLTVGRIGDCLLGVEFSFVGPHEWNEQREILGADLDPLFVAAGIDVSRFQDAQEHRQSYRAKFYSAELNRKWWGWDVISTTLGVRYLSLSDDYRFDSVDLVEPGTGSLRIETDNQFIGPQIGLDLFYPIGMWTSSLRGRAGIFANFAEGDIRLVNAGVTQFANGDEDIEFGFLGELGYFVSCRILRRVSVFAGYELWCLYGAATAGSQPVSTLTRDTGKRLDSNDDLFFHGGSAGLEIVW